MCLLAAAIGEQPAFAQSPNDTPPAAPPAAIDPADPLEAAIPADYVQQLELDVDVRPDRISLRAIVSVVIHRGEGWHPIDLKMGQIVYHQHEYSGPGMAVPDQSLPPADTRWVWNFKGIGTHRLILEGWFPTAATVSDGQFQLALPALPPSFGARLHVRIPDEAVTIAPHESLNRVSVTRAAGITDVTASVVGEQLVFAWQTPRVGAEVAAVRTQIDLQPMSDRLTLIATQSLTIQRPGLDELLVRLPEQFRLISVTGRLPLSSSPAPDRPGWTRVRLAGGAPEQLELQWILEQNLPADGTLVEVDGFQVEGALREEGLIRIGAFDNARIAPLSEQLEKVLQVDAASVPNAAGAPALIAYEYRQQPFRLAFRVNPVEPFFLTRPQYELDFRRDRVQLTADFPLQFERNSSIRELLCDWPGLESEGWQVISVDALSDEVGLVSYDAGSESNVLRLFWQDSLSADALIRVICTRPLATAARQEIPISLPVPRTSQFSSGELAVVPDDPLSVTISRDGGDGWTLLEPLPNREGAEGRTTQRLRTSNYRLDDPYERILATIVAQPLSVSATSVINILDADTDDIHVEQTIHLDIRHGRIETLPLDIPEALGVRDWELPVSLEFELDGDAARTLRLTPDRQLEFPLPLIGEHDVRIRYRFPLATSLRIVDVDLPIVSLAQPFSLMSCQIDDPTQAEVRTREDGWQAVATAPRADRWTLPEPEATSRFVPLTVGGSLSNPAQPYAVDHLLSRTILLDGAAESFAEIHLQSRPPRIVCLFPPDVEVNRGSVLVDGVPVEPKLQEEVQDGPWALTIPIPARGRSRPVVMLRYRQPAAPSGWVREPELVLPGFNADTWVEQTTLELQLPAEELLLRAPRMVPLFHWSRRLLLAPRAMHDGYRIDRRLRSQADVPEMFRFSEGSYVAFTYYEPLSRVRFTTIDRAPAILGGAATMLILGYLFGQFSLTRNVSFLAGIGLVLAVVALWFEESLLVFLQPAVLGLCLAGLALWMESARHRPRFFWWRRRWGRIGRLWSSRREGSFSGVSTKLYRPAVPHSDSGRR